MGAWGSGSFENDDALDWSANFCDAPDEELLSDALSTVAEVAADEYLEAPECSIGLAAAEVIAASKGAPSSDVPHDLKARLSELNIKVDARMVSLALRAVERIKTSSELKELWDESEGRDRWYAAVTDLEARLKQ